MKRYQERKRRGRFRSVTLRLGLLDNGAMASDLSAGVDGEGSPVVFLRGLEGSTSSSSSSTASLLGAGVRVCRPTRLEAA